MDTTLQENGKSLGAVPRPGLVAVWSTSTPLCTAYVVAEAKTTIGRDPSNDLFFPDDGYLSRAHGRIAGGWIVEAFKTAFLDGVAFEGRGCQRPLRSAQTVAPSACIYITFLMRTTRRRRLRGSPPRPPRRRLSWRADSREARRSPPLVLVPSQRDASLHCVRTSPRRRRLPRRVRRTSAAEDACHADQHAGGVRRRRAIGRRRDQRRQGGARAREVNGHEGARALAKAPKTIVDVSLRKEPTPHRTGFMIEGGLIVTAASWSCTGGDGEPLLGKTGRYDIVFTRVPEK